MSFSMKGTHNSPANHSLQRQAVLHSFKQDERAPHSLLAHANSFANLPLYKTPPSIVKGEKTFNPFNRNLMERLESSTFSPTVFKDVISPGELSSREFRWNIDDVSRFKPAKIEESSVHHEDVELVDSETEQSAQDAIERYFSKVEIPSPWDEPKHCSSPLAETPKFYSKSKLVINNVSSSSITRTDNRQIRASSSPLRTSNVAVQTCLSLPPVLPANIEAILKPYLQVLGNENEHEEQNLNASSLRRKLNFTKENQGADRIYFSDESMSCDRTSFTGDMSSPIEILSRVATPLPMSMLSLPDISPILNSTKGNHSRLMTRLDFTGIHSDLEEIDAVRPTKMSISTSQLNIHEYVEGCNTIDYDDINQPDGMGSSQDTGYQTQSSEDRTGSRVMTATNELMETTDNPSEWGTLDMQTSSTPTKDKCDFKVPSVMIRSGL